jgi:RimJ/RimL family protein N-acetyltransferase
MCAAASGPVIATERLVLRAPRLDDTVWIAELANDVDVARMTTGVRHPYRLADAEAFLTRMASADPRQDRPLLIEHVAFGVVGMTGFHRHVASGMMELGYWLGRTFRGRGFATEAVTAALDWAGREPGAQGWGKRAVVSSHFADNPASARVLEKAGFLYTGAVERRFSQGRGQAVETRIMVRLA